MSKMNSQVPVVKRCSHSKLSGSENATSESLTPESGSSRPSETTRTAMVTLLKFPLLSFLEKNRPNVKITRLGTLASRPLTRTAGSLEKVLQRETSSMTEDTTSGSELSPGSVASLYSDLSASSQLPSLRPDSTDTTFKLRQSSCGSSSGGPTSPALPLLSSI